MELYLHVRATVFTKDLDDFLLRMQAFLATRLLEEEFNWRLMAGLKVLEEDFPTEPLDSPLVIAKEDETTFINIWKLPSDMPTDLARVMLRLSEQLEYVVLDEKVVHESQDLVYQVNKPLIRDENEVATRLFDYEAIAFVRHYLWRKTLAQYVLNFGSLAPTWEHHSGFLHAGTYQNVSGLLNEFWEIWGTHSQDLMSVRKDFEDLVSTGDSFVEEDYRKAINFPKDGPDDGLVIAVPAQYWRPI